MKRIGPSAIFAAMVLVSSPSQAQDNMTEIGRVEYMSACASCHGTDAKGTGPLAALMKIETPDLTRLSQRAGGAFPFRYTLLLIDGREVRGHGGDMPVWGARYNVMAERVEGAVRPPRVPGDPELIVKGRLMALVSYLETIQD